VIDRNIPRMKPVVSRGAQEIISTRIRLKLRYFFVYLIRPVCFPRPSLFVTTMVCRSLFVLKVALNINQPTSSCKKPWQRTYDDSTFMLMHYVSRGNVTGISADFSFVNYCATFSSVLKNILVPTLSCKLRGITNRYPICILTVSVRILRGSLAITGEN